MRVALVHEYLTNFASSEQVLLALAELFPTAPIYTAIYNPDRCPQFNGRVINTAFLNRWPGAKTNHQAYIPLLPLAVESYDLSAFDLVISDSHIAAKGVITKPETTHICYCHTPIRYAWTPTVDQRGSTSSLRRLATHYLRIWDSLAAKRVDYWLANSEYVARRIAKYYRAEASVIYPPVDTAALRPTEDYPIEDYYILYGRLIDYKRPDLVIEAFNRLGKKLLVIGRGPMEAELRAKARNNIQFITEYLAYDKIAAIFAKAAAMIFPVEEDFGIAMVEMMAAGRPVIAYDQGGAREIITPATGHFFNQQTSAAIEESVANFNPKRYDREAIIARAKQFDRQTFKERISQYISNLGFKVKDD